jgi:hypothetical protein
MNFQKVHGFELADNGFIKKLRPEVVMQDPDDIKTAGRIWYNRVDHKLKFSDFNDDGELVTRIVLDEEEVKNHTAAMSTSTRGIEILTDDPVSENLRAGRIWLNTTTGRIKFSNNNSLASVQEFAQLSHLQEAMAQVTTNLQGFTKNALALHVLNSAPPTTPLTPTEIAALAAAEIAAMNAKIAADATIAAAVAAAVAVKAAADLAEENYQIAAEAVRVATAKANEAVRVAAVAAALAVEEATELAEENAEKAAEVVRIATEVANEAVRQATLLAQANARTATANAELAALAAEEAVRLATIQAEADALDASVSTALSSCDKNASSAIGLRQTDHGFTLMTPLYKSDLGWSRAKSDSSLTLSALVVTRVIDADNFEASQLGRLTAIDHGLTIGEYYYLSDTESGTLSLTKPEIAQPIILVEDADNVLILHYLTPHMTDEHNDKLFWKDLPSSFIVQPPSNSTMPAWKQMGTSNFSGYQFEPIGQTELHTMLNMNHDYALGTSVYYHIHWVPVDDTIGVVRWAIELAWAKSHQRSTFDFNNTLTLYVEKETSGEAFRHMTSESMVSSLTADLEPDCIIMMRIYRDTDHVNDTYEGNVFALQADMHYQAHLIGSPDLNPASV